MSDLTPETVAEAMDAPDFSVESGGISMAAIGAVDRKHLDTLAALCRQQHEALRKVRLSPAYFKLGVEAGTAVDAARALMPQGET